MTTVAEHIVTMKTMPQHLPVCIADWNEEYGDPSESAAESISLQKNKYYTNGDDIKGDFVQIG